MTASARSHIERWCYAAIEDIDAALAPEQPE